MKLGKYTVSGSVNWDAVWVAVVLLVIVTVLAGVLGQMLIGRFWPGALGGFVGLSLNIFASTRIRRTKR